MTMLVLLVPLFVLLLAAIRDVRTREIPDGLAACVLLAALLSALFGLANIQWWMVLCGGLLGVLVGAAMFHWGRFGGGDAKLIAATGAFVGPVGILIFLFWTALAGGVLALLAVLRGQRDYAYVPAIALGYMAYLIWPTGALSALAGYGIFQ